ncbi:protein terminal ear1 homolog [Bidens hawaiensis]|uniref:protein terminal ear1 homolog n=1 Tax=Bidens hawaiensis TaxID=980011 RepID=UPI0040493513
MEHNPTLNPIAQEFRPTCINPSPYYAHTYPYNFNTQPPPPPPVVHFPPPLPPPSPTPTRTLLLSLVPSDVSESLVRRDLEFFGDVRAVQMDRVRDGIVTVHFYDLRQAVQALHEIQQQHMQQQYRLKKHFENCFGNSYLSPPPPLLPLPPPAAGLVSGRAVWAQFSFPVAGGFPDGNNQGTLVVFNLNPDVTTGMLKGIFEAFGCVKELRETPSKKNQKFVEFYDTRDASKALNNINGKDINGKIMVVEFSRPGAYRNGPKLSRFNHGSIGLPPVIVPRKFPIEARPYRPPPTRSPPPQSPHSLKKVVKKQPEQQGGGRSWSKQRKGSRHMRERFDPRFLIKGDGVISESSASDSRTTVMIKNIPNKYSQKLLLNMLDSHCIHCNEQIISGCGDGVQQPQSSYDFVYLPIDFVNKCNVGYGFVNMTSPEATLRLHNAFHHQNWEVFNSKKICEVSYARLQGLEALKEHFRNSKFPSEAEEYMPVVFDPPRDGQRMSQTIPIVGRTNLTSSDDHDEESEHCSNNINVNVTGLGLEDVESDDTK